MRKRLWIPKKDIGVPLQNLSTTARTLYPGDVCASAAFLAEDAKDDFSERAVAKNALGERYSTPQGLSRALKRNYPNQATVLNGDWSSYNDEHGTYGFAAKQSKKIVTAAVEKTKSCCKKLLP